MRGKIGIDVGNRFIRTVIPYDNVYEEEPSVIAVSEGERKIVACGNEALSLAERLPGGIQLVYPFSGERIADTSYVRSMMSYILKKTHSKGSDVYLSMAGIQNERTDDIFLNALERAGDVTTIDSTLAAMYGSDIRDASDSVIINIGASTADMAVYNNGKAVRTSCVSRAGKSFDKAIMSYLYRNHHARVTAEEAEKIKCEIGTLVPSGNKLVPSGSKTVEYSCLRPALGLPKKLTVSEDEIVSALEPVFDELVDSILDLVSGLQYQPDKLILTGGSANLRGLAPSLSPLVCMPVEVAAEPEHSVIRGLNKIMEGRT